MAEKSNNKAAVAFRDGLVWNVVQGFEDNAAGERWLRFASIDGFHALRDHKTGRAAQLEVVSLGEINKRKGLTKTWRDAEATRAAEISAAEAEAKRLAREGSSREGCRPCCRSGADSPREVPRGAAGEAGPTPGRGRG
jgi:hypothetical protein